MSGQSEDWTTPQFGRPAGDWFKWGLDRETGEFTVWEVGGPGDGLPTHSVYLESAWERSLGYDGRDVLGYVLVDDDGVLVVVYQESEVPVEAVRWAETRFPGRPLRLHGNTRSNDG